MPRVKVIEKTVWKFDELPDTIREKVLENYADINVDHEWWDYVYEDAQRVGIKITEFDLGRAQKIKGRLEVSPLECIQRIKAEHGKNCETRKTAESFEQTFLDFKVAEDHDAEDTGASELFDQDAFEEAESEFLHAILEDYRVMLDKEYEYLTSEEAIAKTLRCNEYEFNEKGRID